MRSKAEIKKDVLEHTTVNKICIHYPYIYAQVTYLVPGSGRIAVGKAKRGPNDKWNKVTGAGIAVGRARAQIIERLCQEQEFRAALHATATHTCDNKYAEELATKFNRVAKG